MTIRRGKPHTFFVADDSDIVGARRGARDVAATVGLTATDAEAVATALTEIARNILVHARAGTVSVASVEKDCQRGVEVVARDDGPGIADIALAMQDGYSTSGGLGLGLPGARRLTDEFEIRSEPGIGTVVILRKWSPPRSSRY